MTSVKIPQHVAIIMDGNGRWAQKRNLPRIAGHREGIKRVKEIIKTSVDLKIGVLTLFAFSTENWSRPKEEVSMLMRFLIQFLKREVSLLHKKNIKFVVIGRDEPLPDYVLKEIRSAEEKTAGNTGLSLVLALNYGSRQEIIDAVKKISAKVINRDVDLSALDEKEFGEYLYTASLPDPDLLIRTSGEMRLSNFLLWQLSYTELYFPEKYWPDFKAEDFKKAIRVYEQRKRRFGGIEDK